MVGIVHESPQIQLCTPPRADTGWQEAGAYHRERQLGEPVPRPGKARTLDKVGTWPLHSLQPLAFVLPWILAWATHLTWNTESSSPCRTPACCYTRPAL